MGTVRLYKLINEEFGIHAIRDKRLKISRIDELNDPFEMLGADLRNKANRETLTKAKMLLHETRGILCFSQHWNNPLLWSHYADRHRGLCLGFDANDEFFKPVEYAKKRLQLSEAEFPNFETRESDLVERLSRYKSFGWKYEKEYRGFIDLENSGDLHSLIFYDFGPDLILREIIIGANSEKAPSDFGSLTAPYENEVSIFKARAAFGKFRITQNKLIPVVSAGRAK